MSKKGNEELPQKSSENQNPKKAKKGTKPFRPQVFMVGDGFPASVQQALDMLSPNPIDGVRVPLDKLLKDLQKMALGVSRLGPLTGTQIANDLKAPYATIAGNALMAGLMIAFAQKEQFNKELFQSMQKAILKELREYFGLKELMLEEYRVSSGKISEPADPGIPYAPEKYSPQKLEQITNNLSKLAETTRETLVIHQRERENFVQVNRPIAASIVNDHPEMKALYAEAANDPKKKQLTEQIERKVIERAVETSRPKTEAEYKEKLEKIFKEQNEKSDQKIYIGSDQQIASRKALLDQIQVADADAVGLEAMSASGLQEYANKPKENAMVKAAKYTNTLSKASIDSKVENLNKIGSEFSKLEIKQKSELAKIETKVAKLKDDISKVEKESSSLNKAKDSG